MNPQMSNLTPIAQELLRMSWEFVQRIQAQPELKQFFLDWHAFEGAKFFLRSVLGARGGDAHAIFVDMARKNPRWMLRLSRARGFNRFDRQLMQPAAALAG